MGKNKKHAQQKKKCYRHKVETLREKDERALKLIKQHVDESILPSIADATSAREAWEILRRKFGERGSSHDEAAAVVNETDHVSFSHTKHVSSEFSESHSSDKLVDDDKDNVGAASPAVLQENPTIYIAEDEMKFDDSLFAETEACIDEEFATSKVAHEAVTAAQLEGEKLMKSFPMRAIVFPNIVLDCMCAGTKKNQPATDSNEKKTAEARYDEEFLPNAKWQNLKDEISLITDLMNGTAAENEAENENEEDEIIKDFLKNVDSLSEAENDETESVGIQAYATKNDSSKEAALQSREEGSHIAARNEDDKMCIKDAQDEVSAENNAEKPAESIFQKWSIEEIRHYYLLMWHQATEDENIMFSHAEMKNEYAAQREMGTTQLEDEKSWHDAIPAFAEEGERVKLKELEEFQKKKVKMKMQLRRIREF